MNKAKLEKERKKIDLLDKKLLNLIVKRTKIVQKIIKIKKNKKQIIDKKRIKKVLRNIKIKSIKKGIDSTITKKIWTAMIKSYIEFERKNFNK